MKKTKSKRLLSGLLSLGMIASLITPLCADAKKSISQPGQYSGVVGDNGYDTIIGEMPAPTVTTTGNYYDVGTTRYTASNATVKVMFTGLSNSIGYEAGWGACEAVYVTDNTSVAGGIAGVQSSGSSFWMFGAADGLINNTNGSWYNETDKDGNSSVSFSVANFNKINYFVKMACRYENGVEDDANICGSKSAWANTVNAMVKKPYPSGIKKIKVDSTAPTVDCTLKGTSASGYGGYTWFKDTVTARFSATDEESGVKSIYVNDTIYKGSLITDSDNSNKKYRDLDYNSSGTSSYYAYDNVSNKTSTYEVRYFVDAAAPVVSSSYTKVSSSGNSCVCRFTVADNESGVTGVALTQSNATPTNWTSVNTALSANVDFTINGNGTYYLHVKDAVGHTACSTAFNIIVDNEGPEVSSKLYGDAACTKEISKINGWYTTIPAWAKFTATDGSNVASFKINNIEKVSSAQSPVTVVEQISSDNKYVWNYTALDSIGNSSSGVLAGNFDSTKPSKLSCKRQNPENTSSKAIFRISASDNLSGINKVVLYKDTANDISSLNDSTDLSKLSYTWQESQSAYFNNGNVVQGNLSDYLDIEITKNGIYKYVVYDCAGNAMDSTDKNSGDDSGGVIIIDDIDTIAPTVTVTPIFNSIYPGIDEAYQNTIDGLTYYNEDTFLKVEASDSDDKKISADNGCFTGVGLIGLKYKAELGATYDEDGNILTSTTSIDMELNSTYYDKKEASVTETFDISDSATEHFAVYAKDRAGNKSDDVDTIVYLDKEAPNKTEFSSLTDLSKPLASGSKVQLRAKGEDLKSGIRWVILKRSGDNCIFETYFTANVSAVPDGKQTTVPATIRNADVVFDVTENGYYYVEYVDNVGNAFLDYDKIICVDVFDDDDGDTSKSNVNMTKDTDEWVNEETGVTLTSVAKDTGSGISQIDTYSKTDGTTPLTVKTTKYENPEVQNSDTYTTHVNNVFFADALDGTGNPVEKSNEVVVANIDSVSPTVKATVGSGIYSAEGCPVTVTATDNESGLKNIRLEVYEGNDQWTDITNNSEYETATTFEVNAVGSGSISASGTHTAQLTFYVKENGTYRILADDVVLNQGASEAITVSGVDTSGPIITVTGNPTKWTNKDADIIVKAVDSDGTITEMTLDGKKQDITVAASASFVYKATKNAVHEITATDSAGNVTSYTLNVTKIDKDAPEVSYKLKNYSTSLGTVDVVMTIKDELSGVDKAYLNNLKLSTDGSSEVSVTKNVNYSGDYQLVATDAAGNVSTTEIKTKRKLVSIKVTTPPDKTDYTDGEDFDKTGMIVTGFYDDGSSIIIEDYEITDGTNLKSGKTKINIKYTEDGETYTTTTPITVKEKSDDGSGGTTPVKEDDNSGTTPTKEDNLKTYVTSPKTNDDTPLAFMYVSIILVIAAIVIVIILMIKRRQNKK